MFILQSRTKFSYQATDHRIIEISTVEETTVEINVHDDKIEKQRLYTFYFTMVQTIFYQCLKIHVGSLKPNFEILSAFWLP